MFIIFLNFFKSVFRFSKFFGIMGFAGGVQLHTGSHENDFDNYGIKILVKYRDTEPLQVRLNH